MMNICDKNHAHYNAYIVTNGYLINEETVKMFKKAKITGAQITVDGPICMGGCPFNGMKLGKPECKK